jgi:tetratricopeptide (TPR) repeat protein
MTTTLSSLVSRSSALLPQVLVVEALIGPPRQAWLEERLHEAAQSGARTFHLSCSFDAGGPWAGVNELFSAIFSEIQLQRPDLVEHHSLELVYAVPRLRHSLTIDNPTLTDQASPEERVRSYPADRAFRTVHGLIELLDSWKSQACADTPWVIVCDSYDDAGEMCKRFFGELARRRGRKLHLRLIVSTQPGKGKEVRQLFGASATEAELTTLDLPAGTGPEPTLDAGTAAEMLRQLEERIADNRIEVQANLSELIRLSRQAGRLEKVMQYKAFGLEVYNTLGVYADALRYADGLLELTDQFAADNDYLRWTIMVKMLNAYIGLQDVPATMKLAEGPAMKLAEKRPAMCGYLFYMLAMLYARYQKPRNLAKGEEYLERGLAALEEAKMPEDDFHFHSVFNRNGLAMVRNFQGRHQDAIQLCVTGLERLTTHLAADKHRLHRSVLVYNIGQVYLAIGDHDEALKHYTAAIGMDPNYSEYYNERGSIFLQLGRLEEAHADYLQAVELSPPYFEVFTNLGQCYRRMEELAKAIDAYSRALDIEPNHMLALLGRAKAHEGLAQTEAAIADYTAALALDATLWEALASRGVMHYEAGNLHLSLADFNTAIKLKPNVSDLYENRATVLIDLNRHADATSDLETALNFAVSAEEKAAIETRIRKLQPQKVEQQVAGY